MSRHGKHTVPRRTLTGIDNETWAAYGECAAAQKMSRCEWIRVVLERAKAEQTIDRPS